MIRLTLPTLCGLMVLGGTHSLKGMDQPDWLTTGRWQWTTTSPVVAPRPSTGDEWYSIKDPSVVYFADRWHLFCTVRGHERSHGIVYLNFSDWSEAASTEQVMLPMHSGYFCAPQVFYFTPHCRWYLICQASHEAWEPNYQPAFSTSDDLSRPESWTPLEPLYGYKPANLRGWIDFWVICDEEQAHLFFTSNDGNMWRADTSLEEFPRGWSEPELVLQGDLFEASHSYRLRGDGRYLTLVEAQNGHGWRYYKAYLADGLSGTWQPLADTRDQSFASLQNVEQSAGHWTDSISHGELLRSGFDERLEVDPHQLRFLFQGVRDQDRTGKPYGEIPWQLGILELRD